MLNSAYLLNNLIHAIEPSGLPTGNLWHNSPCGKIGRCKVRLNQMDKKHYELTYIISTAVPENEHEQTKKEIIDLLEKNSALITDRQSLGKKKLAYLINKVRHGYYEVVEFNVEPSFVSKIDEQLKLNNNVLRFLLTIKKELTNEEKEHQDRARASIDKEIEEESKPEKVTQKVSLEDLDEKLDRILESDDLIK
ncbi:MAG: 30S ribosomal protein S6 [Candidatus Komeilibacteria bacterium CG_4_10_14_0_2_um_filter_37_10]|uniref:Small ribosomal subunit protein bS6 n=1 Tax=Candidatus Komeilibacteria bacterium CG_4_10_14_0_2_um_filter_37_10 TaxID=1974470 RepID=A0A2M7VF65_9BACT|nr:MAG: 30S ribosomal protein S6 [Candidatus Komeilibacteria bacterium CG_4_10_14_0_2_um_filter_37_10]